MRLPNRAYRRATPGARSVPPSIAKPRRSTTISSSLSADSKRNTPPYIMNSLASRRRRTRERPGAIRLSLDDDIYEIRKQKLKQIEALGYETYPHGYKFTHTVPEILAKYSDSTNEQLEASRVDV